MTINATESIFIDGFIEGFRSGISANAQIEDGNGSNVLVNTNSLTIANGGTIEATNFDNLRDGDPGTGQPGSINLSADDIDLTDNARIEAATQFLGEASGNINLTVAKALTLENNSFISAEARANATGGNVKIDADDGFILALPNQNSDLTANAAQGNGGDIQIDTQAIFGLEERPSTPPNPTNDIDASSEFGLQGEFSLNTPDFDPTSGLINLPASVGDASDRISQNPCEQGVGSQFVVTGKGGLPPNPTETLSSGSTGRIRSNLFLR